MRKLMIEPRLEPFTMVLRWLNELLKMPLTFGKRCMQLSAATFHDGVEELVDVEGTFRKTDVSLSGEWSELLKVRRSSTA